MLGVSGARARKAPYKRQKQKRKGKERQEQGHTRGEKEEGNAAKRRGHSPGITQELDLVTFSSPPSRLAPAQSIL